MNRKPTVNGSKWYAGYVKTAAAYNLITGYTNGCFGPNDKITREQAMTIIARAMSITIAPKSYITRAEVAVIIERLLKKSGLIDWIDRQVLT